MENINTTCVHFKLSSHLTISHIRNYLMLVTEFNLDLTVSEMQLTGNLDRHGNS